MSSFVLKVIFRTLPTFLCFRMVFYLIGLGLSSPEDISLKGLKAIRNAKRVYLEMYTAILMAQKEEIEAVYEKEVILADRDMVESQSDVMLEGAGEEDICFLVVGDVFGATTHSDLVIRTWIRNFSKTTADGTAELLVLENLV